MTPSLSYLAVQAHLHDLHRPTRRHPGYEARVRQMVRHAPPRQVTHRTHHVPVARPH
jgi:hypothetical protein